MSCFCSVFSFRKNGVFEEVGIQVVPEHMALPVLPRTVLLVCGSSTAETKSHRLDERSAARGMFGSDLSVSVVILNWQRSVFGLLLAALTEGTLLTSSS